MPDVETGVIDSTVDDKQDLDLLNEETDQRTGPVQPPVKSPEEKPEEEPKEPKEPKEDEEEEKPPEEDEEDKETKDKPPVHDRPTMQQLRTEFPDLFKKFPSLRDIYYREQEFTQIFSTIEDAKEASGYSTAFNQLVEKVTNADTEGIFNAIKETDQGAFNKISENLLPTLYKISPDLHWKATLPLMQNLVRGFYVEGQRRNDENIKNSADYLSDFIFGDVKVARGEKNVVPPKQEETEEQKQFNSEKAKFYVDRVESFTNSIRSQSEDTLRRSIAQNLDPDNVFSDFIKDTITGKVLSEIDKQLVADKSHMQYMNSLWEKAKKDGFNDDWKSRILSAYLARAKSLVPSIRAKYVSEAQGTSSRAAEKKREIAEKNGSRREPGTAGRTSRESNLPIEAKRVDWRRTSDMDLLEDRVTFKKG